MKKKSYNETNRGKHFKGYKVQVSNSLKAFGETDTKKKTIKINVKKSKATKNKGELTNTILHETLHAKHPRMSEKQVYKRTAHLEKRMSKRSKQKLLNLIKK